jgi:hypothetical protein
LTSQYVNDHTPDWAVFLVCQQFSFLLSVWSCPSCLIHAVILLSLSRVLVYGQTVEDAWHFYLFTKTELEEEGSKQRHGQRITLYHNCRRPSPIKPNK